jgi:hypothetical protein
MIKEILNEIAPIFDCFYIVDEANRNKQIEKKNKEYFSGLLEYDLAEKFYLELTKSFEAPGTDNGTRTALIKEIFSKLNHFNIFDDEKNIQLLHEIKCNLKHIGNYGKNAPIFYEYLYHTNYIFSNIQQTIEQLCYTYDIDYNRILKQHLEHNPNSIIEFKPACELTYGKEQPTGKGKPPPEKPFHEYILHEKNVQIAEQLKSEFKTEKGKSIRLIIEVLIKKKMLTIENRQRQKIYDAMKIHFNRDIGTKQSIFDYKIKEISDRPDFESIEIRIDKRLSGINKTK